MQEAANAHDDNTASGSPQPLMHSSPATPERAVASGRRDIGDVKELADRVNVKARAQRRTEETKQRALAEVDRSRRRLQSADPAEVAGAAVPVLAAIAVLAVILYWMRRRR